MTGIDAVDSPVRVPVCTRSSTLEELYALLVAIRTFEQSLLEMFDHGVLVGTTHTCLGQEATAVGAISALDRQRDIAFSNHRGHGHFLAYCGEVERLYLELMGKPGGVCAGRGGSQHLHLGSFYSNGVQGGIVPVSTGMALAEKMKDSDAIVIVFLGDGTLGQGVVYESFNIASLWRLPIVFVIDDNGYAQSTPNFLQVAGSMRARPEAFGIPVEERATTDVREVLSVACQLADAVRAECRPRCLLLHTYRLGPHSKRDDLRDAAEIQAAWEREPLRVVRSALDSASADRIEAEVSALVRQARERALAALAYEL
jgi:TPP-dependent pyruvate/acetoin dehydrogenase alpha subunit